MALDTLMPKPKATFERIPNDRKALLTIVVFVDDETDQYGVQMLEAPTVSRDACDKLFRAIAKPMVQFIDACRDE